MARAAAKRGRRTQPDARRPQRRSRGRRNLSATEQTLFFSKLRRSAKWAYVLLAVVFAGTFAFLGVGSGNSGLDQLFNNIFHGGSGGTSISKAQKEVAKHPQQAKGYRDLASAYEAKGQTDSAITALQQYSTLKPKDETALADLAGLQAQQATDLSKQYQLVSQQQQDTQLGQTFGASSQSTLGKALGTDPVTSAVQTAVGNQSSTIYGQMQAALSGELATYQKLQKLRPNDSTTVLQVAQVAEQAQNTAVAVAAYKRYLKLEPGSQYASQIKAKIKQLQPPPPKPVKKKSKP
jgi:tetratricopeptide (TPR) repeat protein